MGHACTHPSFHGQPETSFLACTPSLIAQLHSLFLLFVALSAQQVLCAQKALFGRWPIGPWFGDIDGSIQGPCVGVALVAPVDMDATATDRLCTAATANAV